MTEPTDIPRDVPFTLVCAECDVDGPASYEQALAEGWERIAYAPDLPSCNFVGLCATCAAEWKRPQSPDEVE
jgi:hypothetical protein